MEKRIRFTIILVLILIVVIAFSFQSKEKKEYLVYNEALDKTAVTVDDVSLTLKDIAFYVAYEEKTVQEQAILYNPDNPRQYWNVYTDGQFVKLTAKQAVITEKFADIVVGRNKGMIMKNVMPELKGKAEGSVINQVVAKLCQ